MRWYDAIDTQGNQLSRLFLKHAGCERAARVVFEIQPRHTDDFPHSLFNRCQSLGKALDFVVRLRRFGQVQGLDFRVLHRHPVVTSARAKGGLLTMVPSYVVMLVLLLLHTLLPKRLRIRGGRKLLPFWYPSQR